jgi:PEP-CTERM motif
MVSICKLLVRLTLLSIPLTAVALADSILPTVELTEGGAGASANVSFKNNSGLTLTVNAVKPLLTFLGGDPSDVLAPLTIANDKCTKAVLNKGDSCTFSIDFKPKNALDDGPLKDGVSEIGFNVTGTADGNKFTTDTFAVIVQVDDKGVPEPSTLTLIGSGLGLLGLVRKRLHRTAGTSQT